MSTITAALDLVQNGTDHTHLQQLHCSEATSTGRDHAMSAVNNNTGAAPAGSSYVFQEYNINRNHSTDANIPTAHLQPMHSSTSEEYRVMENSRNYSGNTSINMVHMRPNTEMHGAGTAVLPFSNDNFAAFSGSHSRVLLPATRGQEHFTYSNVGHSIPSPRFVSDSPHTLSNQQLKIADLQHYSAGQYSNRLPTVFDGRFKSGEKLSDNMQEHGKCYPNNSFNSTVEIKNNRTRTEQTSEGCHVNFNYDSAASDELTNRSQHRDGNRQNWLQHYFARLKTMSMDAQMLPTTTKGQFFIPMQSADARIPQDVLPTSKSLDPCNDMRYPEMLLPSSSQTNVQRMHPGSHDGNKNQVNHLMLPETSYKCTAACDFMHFRDSPATNQGKQHRSPALLSQGFDGDQVVGTQAALCTPDSAHWIMSPSKQLQSNGQLESDRDAVSPSTNGRFTSRPASTLSFTDLHNYEVISGYDVSEGTGVQLLSTADAEKLVFDKAERLVFASDEFRMYEFKVRGCMRDANHDWTQCPFAHPGEKARRRDPRLYQYTATPCPEYRRSQSYSCKRGDACELAHGVFESWLHPTRYRTQMCKDGLLCKRDVCFFAHSQSQLRPSMIFSDTRTVPEAGQPRNTAGQRSSNLGSLKLNHINANVAPPAAAPNQINQFGQILLPVLDVTTDMIDVIPGRGAASIPTINQLLPHNYAINDCNIIADAGFHHTIPVGEGLKAGQKVVAVSPSLVSRYINQLETDPFAKATSGPSNPTGRLPSVNSRCLTPVCELPAIEHLEVENHDDIRDCKRFSKIADDPDASAILAMYPVGRRNITVDNHLPPSSNMCGSGDRPTTKAGSDHTQDPRLFNQRRSSRKPKVSYTSAPSSHSLINFNEDVHPGATAANHDYIDNIRCPELISSIQYNLQADQNNTSLIPSNFQTVFRPPARELHKLYDCVDANCNTAVQCSEQVQQWPSGIWAGVPAPQRNLYNPVEAFNTIPFPRQTNSFTVLQTRTDQTITQRLDGKTSTVQVDTTNNHNSENNGEH